MRVLMVERDELEGLVPHAGNMCLLDGVVEWNDESITCITNNHRAKKNPLRSQGQLAAVHALEYGAQAMAVHSGLLARHYGGPNSNGYLASLRKAVLYAARLNDLQTPLTVHAERLIAMGTSVIYEFTISTGDLPVAHAQATVISGSGKERA